MPTGWARYVKDITAAAPQHAIAAKTGIAPSVLSRWLSGQARRPSAVQAITFARAYKQSPCEALAAAGYLTAAEAGVAASAQRAIEDYSNEELVAEMERFYVAAAAPIWEMAARFLGRPAGVDITGRSIGGKALDQVRRKTDPGRLEAISNGELIAATTDLVNDRARLMDEIFRRLLAQDG